MNMTASTNDTQHDLSATNVGSTVAPPSPRSVPGTFTGTVRESDLTYRDEPSPNAPGYHSAELAGTYSDETKRASHLRGPGLRETLATPGLVDKIKALIQWWNRTRLARALARYSKRSGGLLSGGMALTTLLSLSAALVVGWTIFMAVLGNNAELKEAVINGVNNAMPGVIDDGTNGGLVNPDSLQVSTAMSITSIVAFVGLVWSALSVVGSLGMAIRSMFGLVSAPVPIYKSMPRNLLGALCLGVGVLVSAVSSVALRVFGDWIFSTLGIDAGFGKIALNIASLLVGFAVDFGVFIVLIRIVALVHPPRRDLMWGAALAALAAGVLRFLGTSAVGAVSGAVLTTATTLVTLILWINLQMRVILQISAWVANPPAIPPTDKSSLIHFNETPNYVTLGAPRTLEWPHHAVTGEVEPTPDPPKLSDAPLAIDASYHPSFSEGELAALASMSPEEISEHRKEKQARMNFHQAMKRGENLADEREARGEKTPWNVEDAKREKEEKRRQADAREQVDALKDDADKRHEDENRRDALALGERLLQEREAAGTAPDNAESTSSKDSAQNTDMSGTSEVIDRADK